MELSEEAKKISSLFIRLDSYRICHYSNDSFVNEELSNKIKDIKLRVFKNGLDRTVKEIEYAGL